MVQLDFTSDICAVAVYCTEQEVEDLGNSIAGSTFEEGCALVGMPWDPQRSDEENESEFTHCRNMVCKEISQAGLSWAEV